MLCINCLKQLTITNQFRKRCHTSTELLLKILLDEQNIQNNQITINENDSIINTINYNNSKKEVRHILFLFFE